MVEQVYRTSDKKIFESVNEAEEHEITLNKKYDQRVQNFLKNSGILDTHSLDETGIWSVHGENSVCDYGADPFTPHLFTAQGRLVNVIKAAVRDNRFFTWGKGGEIEKLEIREV